MPSSWLKLDAELMARRDLTASDKLIVSFIRHKARGNGQAWPGMRTIATATGLSRPAVVRRIAHLEAAGELIVQRGRSGQVNCYQFHSDNNQSGHETLPVEGKSGNRTLPESGHETLPVTKRDQSRNVTGSGNETLPNSEEEEATTTPPISPPPKATAKSKQSGKAKRKYRTFEQLLTEHPALNRLDFRAKWGEWADYRRQAGKKLTPATIDRQLVKLSRAGPEAAMAMIDRSIEHGWAGLFPPDDGGRGSTRVAAKQTYGRVTK